MWLDRFQNEDPGREFWVFKMPEFESMNRFTHLENMPIFHDFGRKMVILVTPV